MFHTQSFFRFQHFIPIAFLTGFYVSEVVKRYWDQFMNLPVPDRLALKLISYIPGKVIFQLNHIFHRSLKKLIHFNFML